MRDTFRHKVDIEGFTEQDLGGGSKQKVYSAVHTSVPCRIIPKRGFEEFIYAKMTVKRTHIIHMRFLKSPTVKETHRIKWADPDTSQIHYFAILNVRSQSNLNELMRLDCLEQDRET
jgi:hypothetical protein